MKEPDVFRMIGLLLFMHVTASAYAVEPLRTRLVGGSGSFEGRVEVYYQGAWGTVCDDGWDLNDAHVVCRTFGYSRASAFYQSAHFGEGTGEIILDDVNCEGSESNIAFCQHNGYLTHNCGHTEDAGVTCDGIEPLRTRLFGGSGSFEGRVEVYYQGAWGTVCDDGWDLDDAHVVCHKLGYPRASAFYQSAHFGQGAGEIILDDVNCEGSESNIAFCQHNGYLSHNCGHHEDAGVTCDGIEHLTTRLVGGSGSFEGRVEVYYQGAWGTVCDDGWDLDDAHVICHTLGYPRATAFYHSANFGQGTGEIILDDVNCEGSESNIAFCQHIGYLNHNCGHAEDAGVTCDGIEPLTTRLVGGSGSFEGRVDVYYQGAWGTVCGDGWDLDDAHVVCHTLGYPRASAYYTNANFGEGTGEIILDDVNCGGSESNIAFCHHRGYLSHNCGHAADAGVTCVGTVPVRLVDGASANEGRVEVNYQGSWGTICDDSWDINDATVVCRMLGYPGVSSALVSFGEATGDIILDNVGCDGSETHIAHCTHDGYEIHDCGHSEDVGVVCRGEDDLQVRLMGGRSDKEGRVEILYLGTWGTVCDDNWDLNDANVVCRMLGYERAENFSCCAAFGLGPGPILLDEVECEGTEPNIGHCRRSGYENHDCDHSQDVGVSCIEYDDLQVRLVGGRSDKEGRVEILYLGTWGTVCDDNWDLNDANVVCRMLGYERAENFSCCAAFGLGPGPILLDEVKCEGTEPNIGHCRKSGYETHDCDHSQDVGVSCIEYEVDQESSTNITTEGSKMGRSRPARHGLIGFLSFAFIGCLLGCIVMAVFMLKYRRSANEARSQQQERYPRTDNQNCYNGSQPGEEECLELNVVPPKLSEGSSWDQDEVYDTPRHPVDEDVYENIQI